MNLLKYFRYDTYEYSDEYDLKYIKSDSKIIAWICMLICAIMIGFLIAIVIEPGFRCDSGFDKMFMIIFSIVLSLAGIILCSLPIKNIKIYKIERKFMRVYISGLFLYISGMAFFQSTAKINGIFVYFIYCMIVTMLLHMNPLIYTLQTLIVALITIEPVVIYFDSVGTSFSFIGLLLATVVLCFYSNMHTHSRIDRNQVLQDDKSLLEQELLQTMCLQTSMQENVIRAIAELVETRDVETGTHVKSTAFYAKLIADGAIIESLHSDIIDDDFACLIQKAAPMHDLGKIAIPDAILQAPRRLTDEEFKIMQQHTIEGAKVIDRIYIDIETPEYIQCASNIAKYHHERWDGKGYPEGLTANNIPIEARIMAIADVFDALVSRRCYKDAYPISEAFDMIEQGSGTQFDPDFVFIFLKYKNVIERAIVDGFDDGE